MHMNMPHANKYILFYQGGYRKLVSGDMLCFMGLGQEKKQNIHVMNGKESVCRISYDTPCKIQAHSSVL